MDEFKPKRILMIGSPDDADPVFSVTSQAYHEGPRHRAPESFAERNYMHLHLKGYDTLTGVIDEVRNFVLVDEDADLSERMSECIRDEPPKRIIVIAGQHFPPPSEAADFWQQMYDTEAGAFAAGIVHGRGAHYGHGGKRMTAFGVKVCVTCGGQR